MPTFNIFLSVAITLAAVIQNNLSKSQGFSREISVVELRYSGTIVFGIHFGFTCDSETYDTVKLYLSLINFSDIFHYFCEDRAQKIKRLNQYIKSHQSVCLFINNRN